VSPRLGGSAALLALPLALPLALAGCGGGGPSAPVVEVAVDASQRTYAMNLKLSEQGVLKADLYGDTAFQRPGSSVYEVRGVRLIFSDPEAAKPGELTSHTGEYDERTGIMVARGDVVMITYNARGERRVVRTEELHYDQRGDRVWSEQETTVEEVDRTLVSRGFESDTRFTRISGRDSRTGAVRVNGGGL
jgi:LPS export ABC transporter protein LptC